MRKKVAISNIAWPADVDEEALGIALELGFSGIELAPSKVFGPLESANLVDVRRYRAALEDRGLAVPALQAILFGVTDAHLFQGTAMLGRLAKRLTRVAEIADALGASACVFGSPGLRDPGALPVDSAMAIATKFFAEIASQFFARDTVLAFEANPLIYQCRFVTLTKEAILLAERVNSAGFGLQLDMGTVFANDESEDIVEAAARMAAHCHISEPNLVPIGSGGHDHSWAGARLRAAKYDGWISVEMKATDDWRASMRQAADVIERDYSAEGQVR